MSQCHTIKYTEVTLEQGRALSDEAPRKKKKDSSDPRVVVAETYPTLCGTLMAGVLFSLS